MSLNFCQCGQIPEQREDILQNGSYRGKDIAWIECACGMRTNEL